MRTCHKLLYKGHKCFHAKHVAVALKHYRRYSVYWNRSRLTHARCRNFRVQYTNKSVKARLRKRPTYSVSLNSCDLRLHPTTLILITDLDSMKTYLQTKNELSTLVCSTFLAPNTDSQGCKLCFLHSASRKKCTFIG